MPRLEIQKDIGNVIDGRNIERTVLDIPDANGTYSTSLGEIRIENSRSRNGHMLIIEGEAMRGTPLRNRHKRNPVKVIENGGKQTLSKREKLLVSYPDGQMELGMGIPEIINR